MSDRAAACAAAGDLGNAGRPLGGRRIQEIVEARLILLSVAGEAETNQISQHFQSPLLWHLVHPHLLQ